MKRQKQMPQRRATGYTLMELLIVIMIIGVLMGVAVVNLGGQPDEARQTAAREEIRTLQLAMDMYRMHNAAYPSNDQGLKALVEKPADARKWQKGGYLGGKNIPKDPWDMEYKYLNPGQHGDIDIYSLGPDKRESDDDIGNWMLHEE